MTEFFRMTSRRGETPRATHCRTPARSVLAPFLPCNHPCECLCALFTPRASQDSARGARLPGKQRVDCVDYGIPLAMLTLVLAQCHEVAAVERAQEGDDLLRSQVVVVIHWRRRGRGRLARRGSDRLGLRLALARRLRLRLGVVPHGVEIGRIGRDPPVEVL